MSQQGFEQVLLLISYLFVTSGLLYRLGYRYQLHDIVRRTKTEWQPQMGIECYDDLRWGELDISNPDPSWESLCITLSHTFPMKVKIREVRNRLRRLLQKIETIDSSLPTEEVQPYPCGFDVMIICTSVSVYPESHFPRGPWHLSHKDLQTMLKDLNQSELFLDDPIDITRLEAMLIFVRNILSNTPILLPSEQDPEIQPCPQC